MTNPLAQVTVAQNTLGYWPSSGDGKAQIYMEAKDTIGPLGSPTVAKLIQLDNTWPTGSVWITSGGGSCGDFKVGDTIDGAYTAADNEKLEGVSFSVEPSGNAIAHVVTSPPNPLSQSGTWSLDTGTPAIMTPCGYVVRMNASDNTIVNSAYVGHDTPSFTGFCLKP